MSPLPPKQRITPPLEHHRARGYPTPELHNWSPPRGVVPYSCFFRSAYGFASSRSQHRQAPTIQSIHFPSTTSTSHTERGLAFDQDTARVTTATVHRRVDICYTLHHQSTITVHAESTPMREADVVARLTGATERFRSITESATGCLGDDGTYALDRLFMASASTTQTYEQATGRATVNSEPVTAHAWDDHLAMHTLVASDTIAQSMQIRNHGVHETRPATCASIAADGQRRETTTRIQERVLVRTGSDFVVAEDASRGTSRTVDPDTHVTVRSHVHRGSSLALRNFWSGVASLTARKHDGATQYEGLTTPTRPGTNTSSDSLSTHEQVLGFEGTRRGGSAGSRGRHAMNRRSGWELYVGNASSMTQMSMATTGGGLPLLDESFCNTSRITGTMSQPGVDMCMGRGPASLQKWLSESAPSELGISTTSQEQEKTHPAGGSERSQSPIATSGWRDEQCAPLESVYPSSLLGLYECVTKGDERATSEGGACRATISLGMLKTASYKSRSERRTCRTWSPASNRAREQRIQGSGPTSDASIGGEDLRKQEGHAREASEQAPLAKVQTATETYTIDHREYKTHHHGAEIEEEVGNLLAAPRRVLTVEDDYSRPEEGTGTVKSLGATRVLQWSVADTGARSARYWVRREEIEEERMCRT
ncbi:uncharacterized protein B0H18DRAFT_998779 [Fomitopsis serialis]|uniref:uncharacterized protein n=1 Tax=Fomitopsis serialis TaxID=139415 RepID=UPI0020088430|nr:uncharacterized protein B0H18DRAFT_998779 [Neoantrodia serialis]KAH9929279.1 hypothetical protein B0H18DRAFT_998779 [Neoantrodia serialis]